jgi:hypothetical protein
MAQKWISQRNPNTAFSKDARWLADQVHNRTFLRLRGFEDLQRWLRGQFDSEFDWQEIPDVITLAPGITIPVPKAKLTNSRDIWPLSGVKTLGDFPEESWSTGQFPQYLPSKRPPRFALNLEFE